MQVVGVIKRILATEKHTESFKSRELHLDTEEQHTQCLSIRFNQGHTDVLDNYQPGQKVKIDINLRGREVEKAGQPVVYNTIVGWRIDKAV